MSPTSPRQPGAGGGARHHHQAAACKVHRDSHGIHKAAATSPPSSSSTNSSVSSSSTTSRPAPTPASVPRQKQPVIIYTHSPKVIRTSPRDFMSIVQKLTGLDSPARAAARNAHAHAAAAAAQDESSSSSSESCANAHAVHAAAAAPHPYADPRLMPPPAAQQLDAHFVAAPDIPLFAPGPSELQLCVPTGLYDQFPLVDAAAPLGPVMNGNGGAVFSPSMVEAMRTFPDY